MDTPILSAAQIEELRTKLETRKTNSAIAQARTAELEKQLQEEFGVSVDQVSQKLAELQQCADSARSKLQEEYAEFNDLWAGITNGSGKSNSVPTSQSATDW